jgi:hypothetical protein
VLNQTKEIAEDLSEFRAEDVGSLDSEKEVAHEAAETEMTVEEFLPTPATDLTAAAINVELDPLGLESMISNDVGSLMGASAGSALEGRGAAARKRLLKEAGGSPGSEAAVAKGLEWLAAHQNPDGSWGIDHRLCPQCRAVCADPGTLTKPAPFGATGLALLPFLGSGHTHIEGDYRETVDRGLRFLLRNMMVEGDRGSLVDPGGNYYSHGLCAIALCEALALTKDRGLAVPAQLLINETCFAQHPMGGGWRYRRHDPNGDTSALGWQLMALKSGHMAGLEVTSVAVQKASFFLDTVASAEGYKYRYLFRPDSDGPVNPADPTTFVYKKSTSAVGLLCRMYLGWNHEEPQLVEGIKWLSQQGPSVDDKYPDLYYDYYATQVMRHYGGEPWKKWNEDIRDKLIAKQATKGHEAGSWYYGTSHHVKAGGRLYCTSLATMILEVYYRHLPIYQQLNDDDAFPL